MQPPNKLTKWHYGATRVVFRPTPDAGALVTLTGLFTCEIAEMLRRDIVLQMHWHDTNACLVDMRRSVIAIDRGVYPMRPAPALAHSFPTPTALLVPRDTARLFQEWASLMAAEGLPRFVFTDDGEAREWLRDRLGCLTLS